MIISASRRTDIPAFYSEWFINRIKEGFVIVRNPMNNQPRRILLSPDIVDCIVFWTKNPIPIIPQLDKLKDYCYYFQFTLTSYGKDIERNLPDKKKDLISAFQRLSKEIGPERVIWRYDPILINERYTKEYHLKAFEEIAGALNGYTEKCVFSFIDIYGKNKVAMQKLGIQHNACIDKALIEHLTGGKIKDTKKNIKDAGQREVCKCMTSKEIGTHNTCGNGCVYCYANYSSESVKKSMAKYDPKSPILCDRIEPNEEIKDAADMNTLLNKDLQLSFIDFYAEKELHTLS